MPAIGGPRVYPMDDLARSYLEATGRQKPIVSMPIIGSAARAQKDGVNLAPDRAVGPGSWEEFLIRTTAAERADEVVAA